MNQETLKQKLTDEGLTEGVYYDPEDGDYVRIELQDDDTVALVHPFDDAVMFECSLEEFFEDIRHDLYPIPEQAVENPAEFVSTVFDRLLYGTQPIDYEPFQIEYAREAVEFVEKE